MRYLSAGFIFPVSSPPVAGGIVAVNDKGVVEDILKQDNANIPGSDIEHFDGILCPGFVNTHCHLELSWAKGLTESGTGLDGFLRSLDSLRHNELSVNQEEAIEKEGMAMYKSGVVATGDISNSTATLRFKKSSPVLFHTFAEVFASDPANAGTAFAKGTELAKAVRTLTRNNRASVTPHSTYSVTEQLFRMIAGISGNEPVSIHHQETPNEVLFFANGEGSIATRRLFYNPGLEPFIPSGKRPLESIAPFLDKDRKTLLVHNTFATKEDISFARKNFPELSWCFCPNANLYIENRLPDIPLFIENGCDIVLGTDSLASNHQLSILEEMKTISAHFPFISLQEMITWSTLNGARFFGFDSLGSFQKGKSPGIVNIQNIDNDLLKLKPESTSRLIIPASQ
jgi:cytosine/adenosine deaminase-related metal-dependent hydrolase